MYPIGSGQRYGGVWAVERQLSAKALHLDPIALITKIVAATQIIAVSIEITMITANRRPAMRETALILINKKAIRSGVLA